MVVYFLRDIPRDDNDHGKLFDMQGHSHDK